MDLAELGIKISSGEAVDAARALGGFAVAAEKADAANTKMARGSKAAGAAKRQQAAEAKAAAAAEKAAAVAVAAAEKAQAQAAKEAAAAQAMLGKSMQSTGMHASNLTFQLNDIAVMLAAGQNPMMLAMQQGTQISQVFSQMGSKANIISGLGAAFSGMVNPISLATIGVIGLGGALVQWMTSGSEEVQTLDDAMNALAKSVDAVNAVSKNYSMDGLQSMIEKYGEIDTAILTLIERQTELAKTVAMQDANNAISALRDEYGGLLEMIDAGGQGGMIAQKQLADALGLSAVEGIRLRDAMNEAVAAMTFDEKAAALAKVNDILDGSSAKTGELYKGTLQAQDAMLQLANSAPSANWMDAAIGGIQSLTGSIWGSVQALGVMAQKQIEVANGNKAPGEIKTNNLGLIGPVYSGGGSFMNEADFQNYNASQTQSQYQIGLDKSSRRGGGSRGKSDAERAAEKAIKDKEALAKKYADLVSNQNQYIEKTRLEMSTIGMTEVEADKLMRTQDLLNKATDAGIKLTPEMADELTNLAVKSVEAEAELKKLQESYDFAFDTAKGFASDFFDGIKNGESVWDSLKNAALNALDKISDKLLDMAMDGLLTGLLGGLFGGGGGGFIANTSLTDVISGARANGGPVSGGSAYLVGERGPEIFKPRTAGDIIPNHAMRPANTDSANSNAAPVVNNSYNITVNNSTKGVEDQIVDAIKNYDKLVAPQTARSAVQRGQKYGVMR